MSGVSPPDPSSGPAYKAQYVITPEMRATWQRLFKGQPLSDQQVAQINDGFIKNVWDQMSQVLNWALDQQKERDQQEKEDQS